MIEYFPNSPTPEGRSGVPEPVPAVLTEDEAIRYLRLDVGGERGEVGRDPECARRALRRLVETKRIRPARIGQRNRYAREELRRFLLHATELAGEAPTPQLLEIEGNWRA